MKRPGPWRTIHAADFLRQMHDANRRVLDMAKKAHAEAVHKAVKGLIAEGIGVSNINVRISGTTTLVTVCGVPRVEITTEH